MNSEFKSSSKQARSVFFIAAIVSTALVLSGIAGLAEHYSGQTHLADRAVAARPA
ncbi:MAG: hypothetical protein MUD07_01825 [Burkholderiaceae bacterium]|jgi:hypothetical protein|nr:hypothetical protein [Burkholderiaceae bacterium]